MQSDERFGALMQNYTQALQFQVQQEQNAQVGRIGVQPVTIQAMDEKQIQRALSNLTDDSEVWQALNKSSPTPGTTHLVALDVALKGEDGFGNVVTPRR